MCVGSGVGRGEGTGGGRGDYNVLDFFLQEMDSVFFFYFFENLVLLFFLIHLLLKWNDI